MRSPLCRSSALTLVVGAATLAGAATAQGEVGVYRDPNSPAGFEYKIPLERAREEATGRPLTRSQGSYDAPLFGEGISSARSESEGRPALPRSTNARRPRSAARLPRPSRTGDARLAAAPATPDSNVGWMVAVGAALVASAALLGLGAGRLLR